MARYSQFAVLFVAFFATLSECRVSPELQVDLPHGGGIIGKYMTSFRGRGIRAFLGVPYAEPPVGDLRFKAPFPKLPWLEPIQTNVDNKMCPQGMGVSQTPIVIGSEDCLYVNVYAPLEPKTKGPLPVMFYIHGGAFNMGNGGAPIYTPEFILDHDVILVSGNYRLGAFGFLSLGSSELPGNLGLKDQSLLLQWVQDNIATFGGDPNQVTIFGESAGGGSVAYHLISPLSHKKFHKAIVQSGTQYAPWAFDYNGRSLDKAIELGKELNCSLTKEKETYDSYLSCLKTKSADEIILASAKLVDTDRDMLNPFLPVAEESLEGFVSKRPIDFRRSHGLDIPIMIGVTAQEGIIKIAMAMSSEETWEKMNVYMDSYIDQLNVGEALTTAKKEEIRKLVKDFYFKNGRFEMDNHINSTNFFTDTLFMAPTNDFLVNRLETNTNSADTFVYFFNHRGAASLTDLFGAMLGLPGVEKDLGVAHCDDLFNLFPINKNMVSNIVPTKTDGYIQRVMTDMWVNFAKTGRPTNSDSPVAWNPATKFPLDYLRIGNYGEAEKDLIGMEKGLLEERMTLWRQVRGISNSNN